MAWPSNSRSTRTTGFAVPRGELLYKQLCTVLQALLKLPVMRYCCSWTQDGDKNSTRVHLSFQLEFGNVSKYISWEMKQCCLLWAKYDWFFVMSYWTVHNFVTYSFRDTISLPMAVGLFLLQARLPGTLCEPLLAADSFRQILKTRFFAQ